MKKTLIAAAFALAGFVAFAAPASADTPRDRRAEIVRTADLDLSSEAGAATFERRLRAATRRVCHRPTMPASLAVWRSYRTCTEAKLEKALTGIDAPHVLARFDDVTNRDTFQTAMLD